MILIYRAAGGLLALFFGVTALIINYLLPSLFHISENWWLVVLLTAIFAGWLELFSKKQVEHPDPNTTVGRMFINWGEKHSLFFIPIKYWAFILIFLSVYLCLKQYNII